MSRRETLDFSFEVKQEDVKDDGTFIGMASTFGGKPDDGGDVVIPGAFKKTIKKGGRNGTGIPLLWQHEGHNPIGIIPRLEEVKRGLEIDGDIEIEATQGRDAHLLLKKGAVKGISIGFDTVQYEIDRKKQIRYLKEVELWEISIVTFPMNTRARVLSVKAVEEAETPRELENALRDAGLSKTASQYIVKLCTPSLRESGKMGNNERQSLQLLLSGLKDVRLSMKN